MSLSSFRSLLYRLGRLLSDVNAVEGAAPKGRAAAPGPLGMV
jgi:hypothetical protein